MQTRSYFYQRPPHRFGFKTSARVRAVPVVPASGMSTAPAPAASDAPGLRDTLKKDEDREEEGENYVSLSLKSCSFHSSEYGEDPVKR